VLRRRVISSFKFFLSSLQNPGYYRQKRAQGFRLDFCIIFIFFQSRTNCLYGVIYSVADPNPGSGAFLTPGSGMEKKSGSGVNIPDQFSESVEKIFEAKNT
jgi:hypothetical protein